MKPNRPYGDASVYLEKYLQKPRHHRNPGARRWPRRRHPSRERDCSLQRRHQKVWEEGPSPVLAAAASAKIGATCAKAMQDIKYLGVGTIEFLFEDGEFYFIEMNTRIQVEHPVTEMITISTSCWSRSVLPPGANCPPRRMRSRIIGLPAIEWPRQCGKSTDLPPLARQDRIPPARRPGVRIDSAVYQGYVIPPYYDSLSAS